MAVASPVAEPDFGTLTMVQLANRVPVGPRKPYGAARAVATVGRVRAHCGRHRRAGGTPLTCVMAFDSEPVAVVGVMSAIFKIST